MEAIEKIFKTIEKVFGVLLFLYVVFGILVTAVKNTKEEFIKAFPEVDKKKPEETVEAAQITTENYE